MELNMISEIGKIVMIDSIEYKITYIDEKKKRITVEPIEEKNHLNLNQAIIIENHPYIVTYINEGKKRISLQLVNKGV